MNRPFKFRGKDIHTGVWLYGDLVHSADGKRTAILVNDRNSYDECEVQPESIGQFTGHKDCNGSEIYEDDIVIYIFVFIGLVVLITSVVNVAQAQEQNEMESQIRNNTFNCSHSLDQDKSESSTLEEDYGLRIDSTPITLPAITEKQREQLRKTVKKFDPLLDDCQGAIMHLVGMSYRSNAAKEVYCTLKIGDKISLKPEPDNKYDDTVVKVFAKRCHIGYIPQNYSNTIYWYCILNKICGCYVIEEANHNRLSGLKFVLFVKP